MRELPHVERDDPRIGVSWLTARQLAERYGLTVGALHLRLTSRGLGPVARTGRNGAFLFELTALEASGAVLDRAFDPVSEVFLTEYARERGYRMARTLIDALRSRLAAQLGDPRRMSVERLEEAGIARRLGGRWVVRRAAADALLSPPYDPAREATLEELRREFGFQTKSSIATALKGHIEGRRVVLGRGHRSLVFDREKAHAFLAGRWVPGRTVPDAAPSIVGPQETWRSRVGPFELMSPTQKEEITAGEAEWLLGASTARAHRSTSSERESACVAYVESELVQQGDFEGLLLLARILDGALLVVDGLGRTAALVSATEKAA